MSDKAMKDAAHFYRPSFLPGVELVSVDYHNRAFPNHSHAEYVVGAIVSGEELLDLGGTQHRIGVGTTLYLNPGQTHSNASCGSDRLGYLVFYISPERVAFYLRKHMDERPAMPKFRTSVRSSCRLFRTLTAAHARLRLDPCRLEQETILSLIVETMAFCGSEPLPSLNAYDGRIARARAFIDENFAEQFGLADLASLVGLSPFHLIRCFREQTGLTPLAYRNQRRIAEARGLLRRGASIAETAAHTGFADQSHLTRHFQRIVGTSPGRYAQQ